MHNNEINFAMRSFAHAQGTWRRRWLDQRENFRFKWPLPVESTDTRLHSSRDRKVN